MAIFVGYASQPAQDWAHPENNTQYIPHITLPSTVRPTFNGIDSHNYTERKWFVGLSLAPRSFAGEFNTTEQFDKPGYVRACGCARLKRATRVVACAIQLATGFFWQTSYACTANRL